MALSSQDIKSITSGVSTALDPQFAEISRRFDQSSAKVSKMGDDLEQLSSATKRMFHTAFTDIAITREDLRLVKQIVAEHDQRLDKLESRKKTE